MPSFLDTAELLPSLRISRTTVVLGPIATAQLVGSNPYRLLLVVTVGSNPASIRIWPGSPVPNPGGWQMGTQFADTPRIHSFHAKDFPGIVQDSWFGANQNSSQLTMRVIEVSFDSGRLERSL